MGVLVVISSFPLVKFDETLIHLSWTRSFSWPSAQVALQLVKSQRGLIETTMKFIRMPWYLTGIMLSKGNHPQMLVKYYNLPSWWIIIDTVFILCHHHFPVKWMVSKKGPSIWSRWCQVYSNRMWRIDAARQIVGSKKGFNIVEMGSNKYDAFLRIFMTYNGDNLSKSISSPKIALFQDSPTISCCLELPTSKST